MMSKLISNILLFSFLCSMIMLMIGGVIMNIKKKAYLYLGLLGVGLMLGSFGALISRNTGSTLALPDDTSDCDDASASDKGMCFNCIGSSGTWDSGSCSCPPGMELNSVGKCAKKSSGGSTGGNKTSCSEYDSATATECSNCQESSGTWSFSSHSCRCPGDYTLGNDGICQRNIDSSCRSNLDCSGTKVCKNNSCVESGLDFSDCDDVSLADRYECYSCIKQNKKWSESERKCQSSVYTSCNDYSSSTTKERCNSCSANGTWSFEHNACKSCNSEYKLEGGTCVKVDVGECASASDKNECNSCLNAGGTWNNTTNSCKMSCNTSFNCEAGEYCDGGECKAMTSCSNYGAGSLYNTRCTSCSANGTWSFNSNSCKSCNEGYLLKDGTCINKNDIDTSSCYGNRSCISCLQEGKKWRGNRCVTVTSCITSSECGAGKFCNDDKECQTMKSCNDYGVGLSYYGECNICEKENGTWNFDTNSCVCKEGYEDSGEGLCVKKSSSGSSHKSGFYFIDANGNCKEYPKLPGYCVEAGTKFNRDKLSDYTTDYSVTLSCMEIAAGYFGQKGSGEDYYSAQAKLNGRQYYTDASCTTKVEGSATGSGSTGGSSSTDASVSAQASAWCNTKPSFDGETVYLKVGESKTLTDTTGSLSDFTISGGSSSIRLSSSDNSITVTALAKSGCEAFTMSKGNSNSYQVYGYVNSQKYAEIYNLPLVTASFTVCTTDETVPDTYGGFKIVKKDGDNVALSGVKFKVGTNLHGTEGTDWSYMTTDVNGEIKVGNIKSGTKMYYQEVSTKDGYVLDGNIYNLSIKANEIIIVTVLNYKNDKVMFKLLKTNEGGEPLPGVKFKVGTNLNGTEGTDWSYMITDASGVITVGNIPKGTTYYYQEISTLDGYIVDNTIKKVILDVDNGIYVKGEVNYLDRVATIVKKDAETGQVLRNVVFEIYDAKTDKLLYTKTTDALGKIVLKGISNGKYYAKEKSAPDGYLLNTDKHSFEISDTNKSVEIVITNKKDNPNTGSTLIYVTMVLGLICLCVSVVQYRKLKNIEFM